MKGRRGLTCTILEVTDSPFVGALRVVFVNSVVGNLMASRDELREDTPSSVRTRGKLRSDRSRRIPGSSRLASMADENAHGEAEASDDAALQTTSKNVDVLYDSDAVYSSGQMLEIHPKNCHFCHFSGSSARLPGGTARSGRRCSITRLDMSRARPGHSGTECVEVH
jgi:hypothetical protein